MNREIVTLNKLQDQQWQEIEPIFPGNFSLARKNNRLFIDAIFWIVEQKGMWTTLPIQYGNWRAVYMRFRRWSEADFWSYLTRSRFIEDRILLLELVKIEQFSQDYLCRAKKRRKMQAYKISRSKSELESNKTD